MNKQDLMKLGIEEVPEFTKDLALMSLGNHAVISRLVVVVDISANSVPPDTPIPVPSNPAE